MNRELVNIISEQTGILLYNVKTMILTCDMDFRLCGQPVWKHVYHALHSCDQWFINPQKYIEPPFHEPGLNSLDANSEKVLSKEELLKYYESVKAKISGYLHSLTDEMLGSGPEGCKHSRLALILGQFRHLYAHLGNINCTTIIETGEWPKVVGLDADFSKGLYE